MAQERAHAAMRQGSAANGASPILPRTEHCSRIVCGSDADELVGPRAAAAAGVDGDGAD